MNEQRYYANIRGVKEVFSPTEVNELLQDSKVKYELLKVDVVDRMLVENPIDPATECGFCGKPLEKHVKDEKGVLLVGTNCQGKPYTPKYYAQKQTVYVVGFVEKEETKPQAIAQAQAQPQTERKEVIYGAEAKFSIQGLDWNGGKFKWLIGDKGLSKLGIKFRVSRTELMLIVEPRNDDDLKKVKELLDWVAAPDKPQSQGRRQFEGNRGGYY